MHTKVIDDCYAFTGTNGWSGRCQVRIYRTPGKPPVVVATELDDNPGPSITNAAEVLYPGIIASYLPGWLDQADAVTLIEHYPGQTDRQGVRRGDTFDLVSFRSARPVLVYRHRFQYVTFGEPGWRRLSREEMVALIGEEATREQEQTEPL